MTNDNVSITIAETNYVLTTYPDGSLELIVREPGRAGGLDAAADLSGQQYRYVPPTGGETIIAFYQCNQFFVQTDQQIF